MKEITFSDSAGGLLLEAGIARADVIPLPLYLDIGSIADLNARRAEIGRLFELFPDGAETAAELWRECENGLGRIQSESEPVRVWISRDCPEDICGLCFICSVLKHKNIEINCVDVPLCTEQSSSIVVRRNIAELSPGDAAPLFKSAFRLSEAAVNACAFTWNRLKSENSPLRAVINGQITSVSEDFYDFALAANIPDGEFLAAEVIGKTLPRLSGVSDALLFRRLMSMAERGLIAEVSAPSKDHPYSASLQPSRSLFPR